MVEGNIFHIFAQDTTFVDEPGESNVRGFLTICHHTNDNGGVNEYHSILQI